MANFLIALIVAIGGWWALRKLGSAQPAQVRAAMRKAAGGGLIVVSAVLAMRGAMQIAGPLFLVGLGMFTNVAAMMKPGAFWKKPGGQKSRVKTSVLEMELDHDTGAMDGTVLVGALAGQKLSALGPDQISTLYAQCVSAGDQSAALLEAWLQRVHPEFRRQGRRQGGGAGNAGSGKMSREEALAVLGLSGSPSEEDIKAAHRKMMKQFHPDLGGTDYLAAKINAAKDTLLV